MHDTIIEGESTHKLESIAKQSGMTTLFEDGLAKAAQGLTTIGEIIRVVGKDKSNNHDATVLADSEKDTQQVSHLTEKASFTNINEQQA
jgi:hypothetical protein